jgi:tight adherence protein B
MERLVELSIVSMVTGIATYLVIRPLINYVDRLLRFRRAQSAVAGTVIPLFGHSGVRVTVEQVVRLLRRPHELERMRAALPDLLDQLAQTLRAGLSLQQAILRVEEQPDAALSELLHSLGVDLALGFSVGESLERFQKKVPFPELRVVALALELTSRTGGDIAALLERSAELQRQSLQMMRSLRTQTAQGRMSVRLVIAIPLGLVGVMAIVMPDYLGSFLSSGLGLMLAAVAIVLLIIGSLGVRRVVNIEI